MLAEEQKMHFLEILDKLPDESQLEVLDFAAFLAQKQKGTSGKRSKSILNLSGVLKNKPRQRKGVVSIEEMNESIKKHVCFNEDSD